MKLDLDIPRLETLDPLIHKPGVVTVDNFLSPEQCQSLIGTAETSGFEAASVRLPGGAQMRTDIRNNDRFIFDDSEFAQELWSGAQLFMDAFDFEDQPACLNERFRFYRYDPAQRFKRHKDGTEHIRDMISRVTFMIYLNDGFEGGATVFSDFHRSDGKRIEEVMPIKPKTGTALFFVHDLWHEGQAVTSGRKYVLRSDVLYPAPSEVKPMQ